MTRTTSLRSCIATLDEHRGLAARRTDSEHRLDEVRAAFKNCECIQNRRVAVFCGGSLARLEIGAKSDLDLFVTADTADKPTVDLRSRLFEIELLSQLMKISESQGFPPFSSDGEYLKIYFMEALKSRTGSRYDDSENLFTVRILLMLESRWIANEDIYNQHLNEILEHYFRDWKETKPFKPLFLLNDLLRYWRTMCLNYEERRNDTNRPFRKKNVNLKFSRMLTVFCTVLPLITASRATTTRDETIRMLREICSKTPLQRLAQGLDQLESRELADRWKEILDIYGEFLSWKEERNVEDFLSGNEKKTKIDGYAKALSIFLHEALTHEKISGEFRRYLIL